MCLCSGMSNVLSDEKKNQILALGGLGWSLRRIQTQTGVRRETAAGYLRAAGLAIRGRGRPDREWNPKPATTEGVSTDPDSKPAITRGVSTDSEGQKAGSPGRAPSASACEPFRDLIEDAVGRGRNAMAIYQDLVDDHGFAAKYASVKRFVVKLRGIAHRALPLTMSPAAGRDRETRYERAWPKARLRAPQGAPLQVRHKHEPKRGGEIKQRHSEE